MDVLFVLAREDCSSAGVVGSGQQAWTQLWALAAVRPLRHVRVFSPTREHRERFAQRAEVELDLQARACDTA